MTQSTASPETKTVSTPAASTAPTAVKQMEREPRYTARQIDEHTWELGVALLGVKREDVTVSLEDKELEIVAQRHSSVPDTWRPVHVAQAAPDVYRLEMTLAIDVDPERISAKLEDGILTLRLPVSEAARPRRIAVS